MGSSAACALLGDPLYLGDTAHWGYGYTANYIYNGSSQGPALMFFSPGDPNALPAVLPQWFPVSAYAEFDAATGAFDFVWIDQVP